MKAIFLILLIFPLTIQAQQIWETPKDTSGKYRIEYIHNFYNRTEDVVAKVAMEFLEKQEGLVSKPIKDEVNKRIIAKCIWSFDGYRNDCVKAADLIVEISIYYKDNRTKISCGNFEYKNGDSPCPSSGTLEALTECTSCKNYSYLLKFVRYKCLNISVDYKAYIAKRQKDRDLF